MSSEILYIVKGYASERDFDQNVAAFQKGGLTKAKAIAEAEELLLIPRFNIIVVESDDGEFQKVFKREVNSIFKISEDSTKVITIKKENLEVITNLKALVNLIEQFEKDGYTVKVIIE